MTRVAEAGCISGSWSGQLGLFRIGRPEDWAGFCALLPERPCVFIAAYGYICSSTLVVLFTGPSIVMPGWNRFAKTPHHLPPYEVDTSASQERAGITNSDTNSTPERLPQPGRHNINHAQEDSSRPHAPQIPSPPSPRYPQRPTRHRPRTRTDSHPQTRPPCTRPKAETRPANQVGARLMCPGGSSLFR